MKDVSTRGNARSLRSRFGRTALTALTATGLATAALTAGTTASASAATRADDPGFLVQTYDSKFYTADLSQQDLCQHAPHGDSKGQIYGNLTTAPDGTVYGTNWITNVNDSRSGDSRLVKIGKYDAGNPEWANAPETIGPAPDDYQAGLVAESDDYLVSASYHHRTLWRVNTRTGVFTELGWSPDESAGDLAWANNGDLIFSGRDGHVYRLPRADYLAAAKGAYLQQEKWIDLGGVSGSTGWFSSGDNNIYGLSTDDRGSLILAFRGGKIGRIDWPPTGDRPDGLYPEEVRNLADCGLADPQIYAMTGPNESRWAPAESDAPLTIKGRVGEPVAGKVTSTKIQAPYTVLVGEVALPDGVKVSPDGTISGAPTEGGTHVASFKLCDASGKCVWRDVTFEIPGDPKPSGNTDDGKQGDGKQPPANPSMNVSADLNAPINGELPGVAGGGTTFEVTDESKLPPGVGVTDGKLTGIPTQEGDYEVPVKACTAVGCAEGVLKINVGPDRSECDDKPAPEAAAPAEPAADAPAEPVAEAAAEAVPAEPAAPVDEAAPARRQ